MWAYSYVASHAVGDKLVPGMDFVNHEPEAPRVMYSKENDAYFIKTHRNYSRGDQVEWRG